MLHVTAAASWMKEKTIDIYHQIKDRLQEQNNQEQLVLEPEPPENDMGFSR